LANYQAPLYPAGSTFYETDRKVYYIVVGAAWAYLGGTWQGVHASLPTDLGSGDAGFLANVSDYGHLLEWSGAAWRWGPGESGSDFISGFLTRPTGNGWHLCDGSTVERLNSDGSLTAIMLPNYALSTYLKLGTIASAGPNVASGTTAAVTAGTPAGTVSRPTFIGNLDTTSSVSASTPVGINDVESADMTVQSGSGATVAAQNHTHAFSGTPLAVHAHAVTPDGVVSQPSFTGTALPMHSHGPGSLDLENTVLKAYYRQ
jgi:hypothetical protein